MMGKIAITIFIFLACLNNSIAQIVRKKEKLLFYTPLRLFFQQNPSLKEVEIGRPGGNDLTVLTKTDSTIHREYYDLSFEGDKYLFEKKFGKWSFPDSLLLPLIDKKADSYQISCKIRHDSIFSKIEHTYYPKDEPVWDRGWHNVHISFVKGMNTLEKELQAGIQHISNENQLTDSVFIFKVIIKKDSTLTVEDQITSENKTYAKAFRAILDRSYPWTPYSHGGIQLSCYTRIYIRINNDKTVSATVRDVY